MLREEALKEIDRLLAEANRLRNAEPEKSLHNSQLAKKIAENINDKEQTIRACISIALTFQGTSRFSEAFEELNTALDLSKEIKHEMSESDAYTGFGNVYYYLGDYDNSLKFHLMGLRIREKLTDESKIAFSINSVGVVYATMKNFALAEEYFLRSLEMNFRLNNTFGSRMAMNNMAVTATEQKNYDKAVELLNKALPGSEELPNDTIRCELLINLGNALREKGNYIDSEKHFITVHKILKGRRNLAEGKTLEGMAKLALVQQHYDKAKEVCSRAVVIFQELGRKDSLAQALRLLSEIENSRGNLSNAMDIISRHIRLMEELHNEEMLKKTRNLTLAFQAESLRKENEISYLRNVELRQAYDEISRKNNELIDSIQYAQYFQEIIFNPYRNFFSALFSESFILSLPKDIVSGDFFWCAGLETKNSAVQPKHGPKSFSAEQPNPDRQLILIILADCTGHGVPGAFVSLVGNNLLNTAVHEKKLIHPVDILNFLNLSFYEMSGNDIGSKAGMDMTILLVDRERNIVEYAGANAGLFVFTKGGEAINYRGNPILIGNHHSAIFTADLLKVSKGDSIYLFSDGFYTQKGGSAGKKLLRNAFAEMLKELQREPFLKHQKILLESFNTWKGDQEQQDDVTVAGFRI